MIVDEVVYEHIAKRARSYGIGNTPLKKVFTSDTGSSVYAKLEYFNRFRSIKDRAAFFMISTAIETGQLSRDKKIIEGSSGNTGIAVAGIAGLMCFSSEILVSAATSEETKKMISRTGANLIEVEDEASREGRINIDGALQVLRKKMSDFPDDYVNLNQYANIANTMGHYYTTGPEIVSSLKHNPSHIIVCIGTGGTITGLAKYFKDKSPSTRIIAGEPAKDHHIQGLKNLSVSETPEILRKGMGNIDAWEHVSDSEARSGVLEVLENEKLFIGLSSGANYMLARKLASSTRDACIVTVFPDSAEKYYSTYTRSGLMTQEQFRENEKLIPHPWAIPP